jgi:hypothetical protein
MLYQRLVNQMKLSIRKSIATAGAAVLVAAGVLAAVPAANAAAPTCATDKVGLETCNGKLANGASYIFQVPSNFKGTMFFWEHGFKSTYPVPGLVTVATGLEETTPKSATTGKDITKEMLRAGYGLAPLHPTQAMIEAGAKAGGVSFAKAQAIYAAMLAAQDEAALADAAVALYGEQENIPH